MCKPWQAGDRRVSFVTSDPDIGDTMWDDPMAYEGPEFGDKGNGGNGSKKNESAFSERRVSLEQVSVDAAISRIYDDVFEDRRTNASLKASVRTVDLFNDGDDDSLNGANSRKVDLYKRIVFSYRAQAVCVLLMLGAVVLSLSFILEFDEPTENVPTQPVASNPPTSSPISLPVSSPATLPPKVPAVETPVDTNYTAPVAPPQAIPGEKGLEPQDSSPPSQSPQATLQVSDVAPQLGDGPVTIGFVGSPMDVEELALIVSTSSEMQHVANLSLDLSEHEEITTDTGDIIHCGIKVDGMAILVKCPANDELCRVYLTNSADSSCEVEMA
jgi:hypothetical protein